MSLNVVPHGRNVDLTVGPTTATHARAREALTALGIHVLGTGSQPRGPVPPLAPAARTLFFGDASEIRLQSTIAFEYTIVDTVAGELSTEATVVWKAVAANTEVAVPVSGAQDSVYVRAGGAGTVQATLLGSKAGGI